MDGSSCLGLGAWSSVERSASHVGHHGCARCFVGGREAEPVTVAYLRREAVEDAAAYVLVTLEGELRSVFGEEQDSDLAHHNPLARMISLMCCREFEIGPMDSRSL